MRLVNTTRSLAEPFGDEAAVRILAKNGFDAIDWSFVYLEDGDNIWNSDHWQAHAQHIKAVAEECGIGFSQAHAPYPTSKGEEPYDTLRMQCIIRSIEASAALGIQNIVVHPRQHLPYSRNKKQLFQENVEMYRSLIPLCEKNNIHVCVENMWQYDSKRKIIIDSVCAQPEEFCAMLDEINSPWIVGCLDVGHAALVGVDPADMIRDLGHDRLKALHIHDVDHVHDCHALPFTRDLAWESIMQALADIDYEGDFTFEAVTYLDKFPKELRPDASALLEKTGRYLMNRIAELKK